ncbi:MAG: hypothetical protein ACHP84_00870 [Caulobacterales bacterium]
MHRPDPISYFARARFRGAPGDVFGIKEADRLSHLYAIGKTMLVNLAKGRIGEDAARILGGLIVSTLSLAAFRRAETPSGERPGFFIHIDEFQTFTTLAFVNMMSELRKYGVGLTLVHQHFHQLDADVGHAVLGNVGSLLSFRVGPEDAVLLVAEFQPTFDALDLITLPNHHIYLKQCSTARRPGRSAPRPWGRRGPDPAAAWRMLDRRPIRSRPRHQDAMQARPGLATTSGRRSAGGRLRGRRRSSSSRGTSGAGVRGWSGRGSAPTHGPSPRRAGFRRRSRPRG